MNKRLRHSRWRRLPGLHRITDRKIPDHRGEPQRLTLYLPGGLLDFAEELANREGGRSVQDYCEQVLRDRLEALAADEPAKPPSEPGRPRPLDLDSLDALADDPEYLAEWSAARLGIRPPERAAPRPSDPTSSSVTELITSDPEGVVARHAASGLEITEAFLPALRRGEAVAGPVAAELLAALEAIEAGYDSDRPIPRALGYDLHRIAFEGQVLLADRWPAAGTDPETVEALLIAQESVARILSGADVRYDPVDRSGEAPS